MENYVGKRLDGRYEIMEILGVGGMAVVYKAFDNIDHRIVAVKILKNEFIENEDFRRRFKNESRAISVLSHPNIVKVFDVSYGDRLQYIVMEYVDGITLKEYIEQQGTVNAREAIYFVTQILRALQHAHDKGIVHRDIKPQNIMLISDGTIKVTDFGIARFSRSETRTMTGQAIGSVHYISPEQAKGSVTDAKSDIYSVGVVLYEMLTGRLPFQSENAVSVALMQLQNDPVMPREINPSIPVGLEQIVIRAMQKKLSDRYQSASEMLLDIEKYKQNPNIKFDYSYFVDSQPTRYVTAEEIAAARNAVREENKPVVIQKPAERTPVKQDDSSKKKTVAALAAALCVVLIFAGILIAVFLPGSREYPVPSLVGLNFVEDVDNNEEYSMFEYQLVDDEESDKPDGTITRQNPSRGSRPRGDVITLYVAKLKTQETVPDVYGEEFTEAEKQLKTRSFEVVLKKEMSSTKPAGTVIRTDPARGESAAAGSLIYVYVATNEETEPVDVPSLFGKTVTEAKKLLEDAGLELDSRRTEYRDGNEKRGTVIGYEHVGEQVAPGTKIAVYVSTGTVPTSETTTEKETTQKETTTKKPKPTEEPTTKKPKPTEEPTTKKPKPTEAPTTKKPKPTEPTTVPPTQAPTAPPTQAPTAPLDANETTAQ